jgi:hypothetical protein
MRWNNFIMKRTLDTWLSKHSKIKCYGFNLKRANECATAKKIIKDVNNFIVNGWKVARHIPKWIHSYKSWNDFINENCSGEKGKENDYEEGNSDGDDKKGL